jgi:DNA-binding NarL/FixJ family response regulator
MEELKALIVDAATGESYERPLTAEELADREVMQAEAVARQAEQDAKADARVSALAKLLALGLTDAEVGALIG